MVRDIVYDIAGGGARAVAQLSIKGGGYHTVGVAFLFLSNRLWLWPRLTRTGHVDQASLKFAKI